MGPGILNSKSGNSEVLTITNDKKNMNFLNHEIKILQELTEFAA